jgi:hypothetical protein
VTVLVIYPPIPSNNISQWQPTHQAVVVAVPLVVFVLVDRALAARVAREALGVEIARAVDDVIVVEDRCPGDWLGSAKPA